MTLWQRAALSLLTLIALACGFLISHDPEHPPPYGIELPVFYALFGWAGCVAIIFVAKALGKLFLQKTENYYDRA
ncbi:MAG: hypothetical protein FJ279_05435 [Planctomycetes bacterium]|nr:hypothetical protein [Planctomycetota bacterium]MBM4080172.1 hypothetical protein [Planctomycetota bacterium]